MITEEEVEKMFEMGFDCSQVVLSETAEKLGMKKEDALRISSCFGIGMAQTGVCGAATGAMMALGMKYGNDQLGDMDGKSKLFAKRDEFIRRFKEVNGAVDCPMLLGKEVRTLEDMIRMKPSGTFSKCPGYCVNAIRILEEML